MRNYVKRRRRNGLIVSVILSAAGLVFLFPLIVTLSNSLMSEMEVLLHYSSRLSLFDLAESAAARFRAFRIIPDRLSFGQYAEVLLHRPAFLILLTNSLKITVPTLAGNLAFSVLTAYGFTIWRWRHKEALFMVFTVVMLMPLQAVLVPNYIVADMLGIKASYLAIILPGVFSPFGVFLMRQSMKTIPAALLEAARMDGASHWQALIHVVLPQMKPAIAALLMLMFVDYWNLVEQAVIFIDDYAREPLSVFLSRIAEGRISLVFAASCVYMFLPLWFLLVGQDELEKGIALSGVK